MALSRAASQLFRTLPQPVGFRCMSVDGVKSFSEKGKVAEDMFFTQEDKRLFAKLLNKGAHRTFDSCRASCMQYKMSSSDIQALLAWKHTHY
ncbi:hypothetical protein QJQ45_015152 [Haematococcus lacustris]|nr:hypothetical protein QJQ45_015152 [Haematococcus lacustris]